MLRNKTGNHIAIIIGIFLVSTHTTHSKISKADVMNKAKQNGKKADRVAWHARQIIVGVYANILAITFVVSDIKEKKLFKLDGSKVLMVGFATAGITCMQNGLQGLDRELKIRRFLKKFGKWYFADNISKHNVKKRRVNDGAAQSSMLVTSILRKRMYQSIIGHG